MFTNVKKRLAIGLAACSLLGTALAPSMLTVQASEVGSSSVSETANFDVIDDTSLFDKRDGFLYEFETQEDMLKHMESPVMSNDPVLMSASNSEWELINFAYFTKAEVKELAADVRSNQSLGNWIQAAAPWMYKVPFFGGVVATMGTLLSNHDSAIIDAANNDMSMVINYYQRVNWDGYSARTRTEALFYN